MTGYDATLWLTNALVLTALLAGVCVWRWRGRGTRSGLRWLGIALLPLALYLTGLLRLVWDVAFQVTAFVSGFVFRPTVWIGLVLAVLAVALIALPRRLSRAFGGEPATAGSKEVRPGAPDAGKAGPPRRVGRGAKRPGPGKPAVGDAELEDIHEMLKRHGIE